MESARAWGRARGCYNRPVMKGFLLGLSSGSVCLTACAPVLVPYLMGEARTIASGFLSLGAFLAGRLLGYIAFAAVAWSAGQILRPQAATLAFLMPPTYIALGAAMALYGWLRPKAFCAGSRPLRGLSGPARTGWFPALLGLFTGLNVCPPFLLALTEAARSESLAGSIAFFCSFFLGTSVFLLPLPALGALRARPALQTVGRLTCIVVGIVYAAVGVAMLH